MSAPIRPGFDLACRLGLGEFFWNGDIDAAYRHQLGPSGITLEQLRAAPGGVRVPLETRYAKYALIDASGVPQGFCTPSRKVELYSETFLEHGYAPLPEYQEPMVSPRSRPDLAARFPLILTSVKHTRFFARVSTVLCLAYASTRCIRRWSCTLRRPRCGALPPATGWRSRRRREACAPVPASTRASTLGSCAASTDGGRLARSLARRPTTPSNLMGPT